MALELFLDPLSQPCRALFIFAKKHQIPFQYRLVELIKGQHWQEAYGKVNPMRQVPVLKEGDFILTESVAILLYLARKFKTPDHWYPSDLQKRARVDEYLSWQHTAIRVHGCKVFLIQVYLPLFLGHPMPPEKLEEALKDLERVLDLFEEKFLQDRPFIVGNEISLADLMAIVELMEVVCGGHDVFKGRPKMAAWRSRVEDAIGKDLFLEAHKEMFSLEGLTTKHLPFPSPVESLEPLSRRTRIPSSSAGRRTKSPGAGGAG
uniref:glutathione transferase n=1 Tax=Salvator merianae TaxID=96440 RepID=A0A8D0KHG4_SALMN